MTHEEREGLSGKSEENISGEDTRTAASETVEDPLQGDAGGIMDDPPVKGTHHLEDHHEPSGRMARIALVLGILSLLGVIFLLFTRNHQTTSTPVQPIALSTADGSAVEGTRVAFVRVDSVQDNYLMTIHFLDSIERRFKSMERDLMNKQSDLEQRISAYYRDIQSGVLQEPMALRIKEQIEKDAEQLARLEDNYTSRMADLQLQLNIIYFDSLWSFLARNKETFGVDMVVGYQQGMTNIFYADPAIDLTAPVIEMLNTEYVARYPKRKSLLKRQ